MKISKLIVYSAHIKKQLGYYRDELGFSIKNYDEESFEVEVGYSVLRFEHKEGATPYHIAFHIPDIQENEALQWLENETIVLQNYGEKIVDFSGWDAKSVYFYDEDKNIMEFISRRKFSQPESAIFSPSSIVGIAEIGLATDDILEKYKKMNSICNLNRFDGDFERFCAVGEPSGLIITINKNEKDWFPTGDKAYTSDFILEFEHESNNFKMNFENDKLQITKL